MESLSYDNKEMLAAARDFLGKDVNIQKRLNEEWNEENSSGNTAALFVESVLQKDGDFKFISSMKRIIVVILRTTTKMGSKSWKKA